MKIFNKKAEFTEQELKFEEVINTMLNSVDTKKNLKVTATDTVCVLSNHVKHFTILVDNVGIIIQNTTFSTRHRLRDAVTTRLKNMIVDSINKDTEEIISSMQEKEYKLLDSISILLKN